MSHFAYAYRVLNVYGWARVEEKTIPKVCEFPPQWPGASPSLTSLMLSQQTFKLKIITFLAEN